MGKECTRVCVKNQTNIKRVSDFSRDQANSCPVKEEMR